MSLAEEIDRLEELAAVIKREAFIDEKTALRSALALRQEARLNRASESDFQVVVFGDLNDFKHINDVYSHEAGDVALRAVGKAIQRIVVDGLGAKAFRQSGDEFVILLKRRSLRKFLLIARKFRSVPFSHNRRKLRTGMSFGYATADGTATFDDLLQRADTACQLAKGLGAGSCVEWTAGIEVNPLVRIGGWCPRCNARISCTLPKNDAPGHLTLCPCCSELL